MVYSGDRRLKLKSDLEVIRLLGVLDIKKDAFILELFCGKGECQELLLNNGYTRLFGLDISETLLRQAKGNCHMQVCSSLNICYKSDTFDIVFINDSLHHLSNLGQIKDCFYEISRVLRDNGYFAFYEPANTVIRKIATKIVLSPLSRIYWKTKVLRQLLTEEMVEYSYWLKNIPQALELLDSLGFNIIKRCRTPMHMAVITRLIKNKQRRISN